jgi:Holliday junction resolvase RusA-like endonuclease
MPKLYFLPGNPIPWARSGYNRNTACIYDRQKLERIQLKLLLEHQHGKLPFYSGPLFLFATFYMPIGKSYSPKKRSEMEDAYHTKKPDKDNLEKWLLDVCTKVLFNDDCLICDSSVRKRYSTNPRTVFSIIEMDNHGNRDNGTKTDTEEEAEIYTSFFD